MTRRSDILLVATMTAALVLAGCTKIENTVNTREGIDYIVAVGTTKSTKAVVTGTSYPVTESFVSSAYYLAEGKFWSTNKADAVPYLENLVISYQAPASPAIAGVWRNTAKSYYWPEAGSLTFFAYSPSGIGATISKDGVALSNYNVTSNQDKDFMVAAVSENQKGNTTNVSGSAQNGVPTVFTHKLARVVVKAALDNTPSDPSQTYALIKSVKFTNIYTTGSYSGANDLWTPDTSTGTDMQIYSSTTGRRITSSSPALVSATAAGALVLPQRHDSKTVKSRLVIDYCVYKNGVVVTDYRTGSTNGVFTITLDDLSSTSWLKNSFITYTLTFNTDLKPIQFTTDTYNWSTGSGDMTIVTN